MTLTERLSESKSILTLFVIALILSGLFQYIIHFYQLTLLDQINKPELVRVAIASMSSEQLMVHSIMTATLDVLYPIIWGLLFMALIYRLFPEKGGLLALPAFVFIPVDLIEGVIQILALNNIYDLLEIKFYLTPAKFLISFLLFLIVLFGFIRSLYRVAKESFAK